MKKQQKIIIALIAIIVLVIATLIFLYLDFRTSVRYTAFQLTMAQKNQDSEKALKYHNIDRMVENALLRVSSVDDEGSPFLIMAKANVINQLKTTLPIEYKQEIIDEYEKLDDKVKNTPNYKIFYLAYTNKPISAKMLKTERLSKNKVKQSFCNAEGKNCYVRTFEKSNNMWKVSDIDITD